MSKCASITPAGSARKACLTNNPTNLFPMLLGTEFKNYLEIQDQEVWRQKIQEVLEVYPTLPMRNVTATKASANKETEGSGAEVTTRLNPGGAVVNLKTNACDFKEILESMQGNYYGVMIGLGRNQIMAKLNDDGSIEGFTGQITAIPMQIPSFDTKLEEFQLDINWDDINEWDKYKIFTLPFDLNDLVAESPLGIDQMIKTALTGSTLEVNVTARCEGTAESETFEAEIQPINGTNVDDPIVTPVIGTNGDYAVTVENGTGVPLEKGEFITYRLVLKATDVYEKVSNWITAKVY